MTPPPAEALYLDVRGEPVFALHHAPDGPAATAVLLCPPWGWDETASYRSRRRWAERLAAAGNRVLRLDLPGSGDSGGGPAAAELLERWLEAIAVASQWLRARGDAPRLALLGLGLGGLLVREAIARGLAAEDLIVWGAPASGRHFVREAKAFAALQGDRPIERRRDDSALPEGWIEAGGFLLSAETMTALKGLKALPSEAARPARALLLGRDGILDEAAARQLAALGTAVEEGPGEGWATFAGHPETTELPAGVERRVREWLAAGSGAAAPPTTRSGAGGVPTSAPTARSDAGEAPASAPLASFAAPPGGGSGFVEEPVRVREDFGDAFGILARPAAAAAELAVVFLNAGAIRHVGPNRLWTEAARRFAAAGVASLRLDLESIGEADGDERRRTTVAGFYDPVFERQVGTALDRLVEQGVGRRFLLVGLCAGGYWSFRAALEDERVAAAVLVNAGALVWHPGILDEREGRRFDRVFQWRWWERLLRREIAPSHLLGFGRLIATKAGLLVRRLLGRAPAGTAGTIAADLDRLRSDCRIAMAFSAEEPLGVELASLGILERAAGWPNLALHELPGSDHTLRSVAAQGAVARLLDAELALALERAAAQEATQR